MASASTRHSPARHFLYPLNPVSSEGYVLLGADGVELPTSYDGFVAAIDYGRLDEWGLATGYRQVRAGDMIWVYFVKPDGAIRAVGRVDAAPHWRDGWERWAVWIRWDEVLIRRLATAPIRYEEYEQRVQGAVNEANPRTRSVLEAWLRRHQPAAYRVRDTAVAFVRREVEARLGQPDFRADLMRAYGGRCAVSMCQIEPVLQAAHIRGVRDEGSHSVSNGVLLRADLHNLFDRGLIWFDAEYVVRVAPELRSTDYAQYEGRRLLMPAAARDRPSRASLRRHRALHGR